MVFITKLYLVQIYNTIIAKPKLTDLEGFNNMIKTLSELNSKIIFLTARNITSSKYTEQNFKLTINAIVNIIFCM